jgi:hypothetical protein
MFNRASYFLAAILLLLTGCTLEQKLAKSKSLSDNFFCLNLTSSLNQISRLMKFLA